MFVIVFACKRSGKEYIIRVSFDRTFYTIDVLRDTVIGNDTFSYFPYHTAGVTFAFEEYITQENYIPVAVLDSYKVYFYDMAESPPKRITIRVADEYKGDVEIEEYPYFCYKARIEIPLGKIAQATVPILPSYIVCMYNPFYGIWKNGNPVVMELKTEYEFYFHELYSGMQFAPLKGEITLQVMDYLD